MQHIIIAGEQGSGKSTLAKTIAMSMNAEVHDISTFVNPSSSYTQAIILDGISSEEDMNKFKSIVSKDSFIFKPKYQRIETKLIPLIIGITTLEVEKSEFKNSLVFKLAF